MQKIIKLELDAHLSSVLARAEEIEYPRALVVETIDFFINRIASNDDDVDVDVDDPIWFKLVTDILYHVTNQTSDEQLKHGLMSLFGRIVLEITLPLNILLEQGFISDIKLSRVGDTFVEVSYVHDLYEV